MDPNAELVQLVERAMERDPDAVRALVSKVSPVVRERIAKALMRRGDDESDQSNLAGEVELLAHETFLALFDNGARALRAWRSLHEPLDSFVALVADHEIQSVLRSGKRRPWTDETDLLSASAPHAAGAALAANETTPTAALDAALERLRADLSTKGFDLFARLHVDGQSIDSVSARFGMNAAAIAAWQARLSAVMAPLTLDALGARAREQNAEPVPPDGAVAHAVDAFDAAAEDRVVARLVERVRDSLTHDLPMPRSSKLPAARPSRRGLLIVVALAGLLALAAVVLFVMTRAPSSISVPPAYELTLVSVIGVRDPTSAKLTATEFLLDPDAELELLARPVVPVENVHARAFLARAGDVKPWLVPLQVSDDGAIRITGITRVLFPTTNEPYDVVIFVAGGDVLPSETDASGIVLGAEPPPGAMYRVVRGHVRFGAQQ